MTPFSIIVPLYNKGKSIKSTLQCVLDQSYSNFEIIVVNDGSTDDSLKQAQSVKDKRIRLISKENGGVSSARNLGVDSAKHNYIAFLDADDYWYPNHLDTLSELINTFPTNDWLATSYEIRHHKKLSIPMETPIRKNDEAWSGIVMDYFANSMIDALAWTSAVCLKKKFFKSLGGFDETLTNMEDTDLWIRAALKSPLVFTTTITSTYILDSENHISKNNIKRKTILDFDKYENDYPNNISLKRYLDYNRYSIALRFKMTGDLVNFRKIYNKIENKNISTTQNTLLKLPSLLLKNFFRLKILLENSGVRIRSN